LDTVGKIDIGLYWLGMKREEHLVQFAKFLNNQDIHHIPYCYQTMLQGLEQQWMAWLSRSRRCIFIVRPHKLQFCLYDISSY